MVNDKISEQDGMFGGSRDHYFAVGQSALHCIKASMFAAGIKTFESILDLPCGYGRVLRHLQSAFPRAQLTACDIDRKGVDFCAATFGATPAYGHNLPREIRLRGNYDLIWVGSLLTHLDLGDWAAFLEFFRANLRRKGLLVFTVHGREVADRMRKRPSDYGLDPAKLSQALKRYATEGFGYANYPITTPGVGDNYGISLSSPGRVYGEIEKMQAMRLLNGWRHPGITVFS
jgi:SAM-dependent methyltransferase